ncbi:MAG: outer membrane protein assembly factor BamB [Gammaproteobacteria bacterium RIFCSPHIGHO2_02_FULL_38_33]|nr:MAG: outer membrane protein assembly factor BamB [Gammaproteobacteria bacterium RIFCSPHIGHO2_02_FULL_38_33]OGT23162.1 MAG: outer membrane protein assembly factor BamB [Gammaproteobacteria bacterium RIFCSPHIGHO2_12_38_15]
MIIRFLVFIFICFLSACSSITGVGKDNLPEPSALPEFNFEFKPNLMWSQTAGVGADGLYLKLSPAMANRHIFTIDAHGQACSFDKDTGHAAWCQALKTPATTGVVVKEGQVFFGTQDGLVYALDETNGRVLWSTSVDNQLLAAPYVSSNRVFAKTLDGNVYALDKKTGVFVWKYEHGSPLYLLRDMSVPQLAGHRVIVGFADGKLAAYSEDKGELLWERTIAEPESKRNFIDRFVDISASPILDQSTIYVVTYQGNFSAIDLRTGAIVWERPFSSYAGMVLTPKYLIVSDAQSVIWALDRQTGKEVWKQEKLKFRDITGPALQNNKYIIVGDKEGYLHWLNVGNGSFVSRMRIKDDAILATPLVDHHQVYLLTQKGVVASISSVGN